MPKKNKTETPKQQAERFAAEVERMKAAGELNPTEAEKALSSLVSDRARVLRQNLEN